MARELTPGREIAIDFTQPRPGDKVTEQLWSQGDGTCPVSLETPREQSPDELAPAIVSISSNRLEPEHLTFGLDNLRAALDARHLAGALALLRSMVPDYTPSKEVLALSQQQGPRVSL
jgi:hypothetical protein